jgi:dTDP-4-dehydrorhamnose reductase
VLRVESLFGAPRNWPGRRGTIEGIVAGLEESREIRVFIDRVVSPTYVTDAAAATRHLIQSDAPSGLYHCVNAGHGTWYEVAEEAARALGVTPILRPITVDQVAMGAVRPRFCALNPGKLAAAGYAMPPWRDALRRWVAGRGAPAA